MFHVTLEDKQFLDSKLSEHNQELIYNAFYLWSDKPSAKSKTDLHYFQTDFIICMGKAESQKAEKEAAVKQDEAERCPVCNRRLVSGLCYTPGCSENEFIEKRPDNPQYLFGQKALHEIAVNLHRKEYRQHAMTA